MKDNTEIPDELARTKMEGCRWFFYPHLRARTPSHLDQDVLFNPNELVQDGVVEVFLVPQALRIAVRGTFSWWLSVEP